MSDRAEEVPLQTAPFADDFIDVAGLNAHVSSSLGARIEDVRARARLGQRSTAKAYAVLGAAGGGKTHIFARLRHREGLRATLILLRPFFGVSLGPRDVLATVIDQLCLPVRGSALTHLEVLTAPWLGEVDAGSAAGEAGDEGVARARPGAAFPSAAMEAVRALTPAERADRVEQAVSEVLQSLPEAAPAAHLARALFGLGELARAERWAELAWLSGREPRRAEGQERTEREGAPLSEADVAHLLRIVSVLAAPVAPLVLTFDQLENLAGDGDARVLGYGNLVAELVDTVPCLTIAQLALTSEWMMFIEPRLTLPQRTRVAGEVLTLESPDRAQREQLLRAWHARLGPPNGRGGRKRFPSPLSPEALEALLTAPGMTPRLLLVGLSRAVAGKPAEQGALTAEAPQPRPQSRADGVWALWEAERARVRDELEKKAEAGAAVDAAELAEGLTRALGFAASVETETGAARERSLTLVRSAGGAATVLYVTGTHHRSVGAALARAVELAQAGKTVVVRERRLEVPSTWEIACEHRAAFEQQANARWLWLEPDEVAHLLALGRLWSRVGAAQVCLPGLEEVVTQAELRSTMAERAPPHTWRAPALIVSWLSDVPRAPASQAAPTPSPTQAPPQAPLPPPPPQTPSRVEPAPPTPPAAEPEPTFRDWLRLGRRLGYAAVSRYADRLRRR
ncbi:MAG TPA: hypothetical protein PLR99_30960 [Polyangiaceae bacterium]|nr:hypothetical protein [Polyangiaceae bacterium]